MNAIIYRIIETTDNVEGVEDLQRAVWGSTTGDILYATTMRWMIHIGGLLLGAWAGEKLVGFSIGSPGKREGKFVFWSDMAGIHPDYQSQGIGYQLKIKQREWVREEGYEEIRWTFDPMRRGNASFNFHKLGVISYLYHPSFYGVMQDSINTGLPTDRLEAIWSTTDMPRQQHPNNSDIPFAVEFDGDTVQTKVTEKEYIGIQIPYNLNRLKNDNLSLAIEWQHAVRNTFIKYFRMGYQTADFVRKEPMCWYVLQKK
jgi:predicted GNAT superfamily acetyltransferase